MFCTCRIYDDHTLVPEVFLEPQRSREAAKLSHEAVRKRKTSGYLGLESHFLADASCQTRQTDNYKRDQWQLGNHASPKYDQSNESITLKCMFVIKVSTNLSLRSDLDPGVCMKVRFKCKVHVTRGFSLPRRTHLRHLHGSSRKTSGTRAL